MTAERTLRETVTDAIERAFVAQLTQQQVADVIFDVLEDRRVVALS